MGFLTTITLHNDALHVFKAQPADFAKALFRGIDAAYDKNESVYVPFCNHANYITVQPSRHADDTALYLHYGNTVSVLNTYCSEFKRWLERCPDDVEKLVKVAQRELDEIKKKLKTIKSQSKK